MLSMPFANTYIYLIFPCSADVASCINILICKVDANYCKISNLDQTFYFNWCHKYLFPINITLMSYSIPFKSLLLVSETFRLWVFAFLSFMNLYLQAFMCYVHNKLMHFVQGTVVFVMGMVQGFLKNCNEEFKGAIVRDSCIFYGWDFI